jgi:tRNA G18 (ribose-2'-O)-methylase SpoU
VRTIHVVGSVPDRNFLKPISGSLIDYVEIVQHSTPHDFLVHTRQEGITVVCAELAESASSIHDYDFDLDNPTCIAVGNESTGVPVEIMHGSDVVFIPMPGVGFCLNTAQTANIMLFEFNRQLNERNRSEHLCAG